MDRRSPDSELETGQLLYGEEDRPKGSGASSPPSVARSPYDLSCPRDDNPCFVPNNNNNDESVENHNVNNNGNSHCHSGECGRAAESNRIRQRNLEFGIASVVQEPGYSVTRERAGGLGGSTKSQHSGHKRLPLGNIGYKSIPCQDTGYDRLLSQGCEYDVLGNRESGRRRSSRLLEELTRRHCDSGVDLVEDFSGSIDYSTNSTSTDIEWDSRASSLLGDDRSKPMSRNAEVDSDSKHSSISMNYETVSPTVLHFDITSCDTSKCCPFYLDHHSDQCPNSVSEDNSFIRQSVSASPAHKTPEYSENDLELCLEHPSQEPQCNDSTFHRLQSSFDRRESGCCVSAKERHSDYESCEDNCDQMCCSDSGSSSYSECGPDCNCSASPDHLNSLPQVRWTARLLGGNEQEVEAFKKKKMASMKK